VYHEIYAHNPSLLKMRGKNVRRPELDRLCQAIGGGDGSGGLGRAYTRRDEKLGERQGSAPSVAPTQGACEEMRLVCRYF